MVLVAIREGMSETKYFSSWPQYLTLPCKSDCVHSTNWILCILAHQHQTYLCKLMGNNVTYVMTDHPYATTLLLKYWH